MSSGKCRPFCLGLNVLIMRFKSLQLIWKSDVMPVDLQVPDLGENSDLSRVTWKQDEPTKIVANVITFEM